MTCSGDVTLNEEDQVNVNGSVDWVVQGNLTIGEEVTVNSGGNASDLNIIADNDVTIGEESSVTANIDAGGNLILGEQVDVTGGLIVGNDLTINENGTVNGCVSVGNNTNNNGTINCGQDVALLANRTIVEVGESLTLAVAAQNCDSVNADRWRNTWRDNDALGIPNSGQQPKTTTSPCDQAPRRTFTVGASPGIYNVEFESEWCRDGSAGPNTFECPATQAGATQFATFGVDSLDIEVVGSALPASQLELRMEELGWDGTSGEVTDTSGAGNNGTSQNGADTAIETPDPARPGDPGTCRYGEFDGADDFVRVPDSASLEMSDNDAVTVTAWVRKASQQSGWIAITQKSDTSYNLQLDNGDEPTFTIHDGTWHEAGAGFGLNTDQWYHLAGTYNGNEVRIYVNGQLEGTATASGTMTDASGFDVGIGENLDATGRHFDGQIDEVRIYDQALSGNEVDEVFNATHPCGGALLTEYRMDEASWSGNTGEVIDQTGNGHDATPTGGANTEDLDPARPGDVGTCGYGTLDGTDDGVDDGDAGSYLNGLDAVTVTAWVYNTDGLGGNNRGIFFTDSPGGKDNRLGMRYDTRGANGGDNNVIKAGVQTTACNDGNDCVQVETQANVMTANTWQHVAMTWESGGDLRVYVDGNDVTGDGTGDSGQGTGGSLDAVNGLRIAQGAKGERWQGRIDEFRVYDAALSQARVQEVFQATHPCPAAGVAGYAIDVGSGNASTCQPRTISITAEDNDGNAVTDYSESVNLTTSTSNGTWSQNAADGTLTDGTSDDGAATYDFVTSDDGTIDLDLENQHADDLTITVTEADGSPSSTSSTLSFRDNAFVIDSIDALGGDVVAGRDHNMRATLWRRDSNGDCAIADAYNDSNQAVKLWLDRDADDPGGTAPVAEAVTDATLGDAEPGSPNIELDFSSSTLSQAGRAPLDLATSDVGKYALRIKDDTSGFAVDSSGAPRPLTGGSPQYVVRPFGVRVEAEETDGTANPAAADASGPVFVAAGADFAVNVAGVLYQSSDDDGSCSAVADDGLPDGHTDSEPSCEANLSDNAVTASFGQEGTTEVVEVVSSLFRPSGGNDPALAGGEPLMFDTFSSGEATQTTAWGEVGIIELEAELANYLGSGRMLHGRSGEVGRFIPDHFEQTVADKGMFENVHGSFTYLGQQFGYEVGSEPELTITARNASDSTTANYAGAFAKLAPGDVTRTAPTEDNSQQGSDGNNSLPLDTGVVSLNPGTLTDNGDGTLTYNFADAAVNDPNDDSQPGSGVDAYAYQRNYDPDSDAVNEARVGPFDTDLTITVESIEDSDGVTAYALNDVTPSSATIRFGRLLIDDAGGPETAPVAMPVRAEYWDGDTWLVNTEDDLTALTLGGSDNEIRLSNNDDSNSPIDGAGPIDVGGGSTQIDDVSPISLSAGEATMTFTAPGVGNRGWVDVTALLGGKEHPYLRPDPDDNGFWDSDPAGRATFGIFAGTDAQIYQREVFPAP